MLTAQSINKRIGKRTVLNEISLSIAPGETVAILGPSGSGKTTLLRLLLGLDPADGGTISWDTTELSRGSTVTVPTEQRQFGLVFQDAALFPHLNVRRNIAFGLQGIPQEEQERRIAAIADQVGITELLRREVNSLSGGERQRVALARSLVPEPRALFLDEPFSSVDRLTRHQLLTTLRSVFSNRKTAVALVTHDARDAQELAHRVILLSEGRIAQSGTMNELIERPASEWVRNFIATGLA
jgi:ABC-type Fe3+/spermidine/putrescine transport system ATPase subunit